MGKALEKKKKEIENRLKNFDKLSKCRNMDFPDNLTHICQINLKGIWNTDLNMIIYSVHLYTIFWPVLNRISIERKKILKKEYLWKINKG